MKKKVVKIASSIFIVTLIICTFLSRSIYNSNLAKVKTQTPTQGNIAYNASVVGEVVYPDKNQIFAEAQMKILSCEAKAGDAVKEGDIILKIDMSELKIQIKEQELEILRLKNIYGSSKTLQLEREIANDKLDRLKNMYAEEVISPCDGIISEILVRDNESVSENQLIAQVISEDSVPSAQWKLSLEEGRFFDNSTNVKLSYQSYEESNSQTDKMISRKSEGEYYAYLVPIKTDLSLEDGQSVDVQMVCTGAVYDTVVPKSAVMEESGNKAIYVVRERKGLFGKEYYVAMLPITVIKENDTLSAIECDALSFMDNIVVSSSKPFNDGDVVSFT